MVKKELPRLASYLGGGCGADKVIPAALSHCCFIWSIPRAVRDLQEERWSFPPN